VLPHASTFVTSGIASLAILMAAVFLASVRRAAPARFPVVALAMVAWLGITAALGASGVLLNFEVRPPPFALMLLVTLGAGTYVGVSKLGGAIAETLPLWTLVLAQAFRLPLELVMHRAAVEGTMPSEMSFRGYNFDIVTGASAVAVATLLAAGAPRVLAWAWNVTGAILLAVVVGIALASSPVFKAFGDGAHVNTWVAYFPFVWLPTVLVAFALAGHIVVFRALLRVKLG